MKQTVTRNGVGAWTTRKYDHEKAVGTLAFTDDLRFGPELLHARAFRSTKAHAEIVSIDVSEAMKVKGVVKVVVGENFVHRFGLYLHDRTPLAVGKVRYVGEPVALVVAETEEAAEEGMLKVTAKYRDLPPVFDPIKAATDNSVLVHPELETYEHVPFITPFPGTNIANWFRIRRGDVEKAFAESKYVVEEAVNCPQIAHGFLEPHCCICKEELSTGNLTIWSTAQSAFALREIIATGLGYPLPRYG